MISFLNDKSFRNELAETSSSHKMTPSIPRQPKNGSIFGHTGLIIGPSEAKNAQEADFHVKTSLALQKPGEKYEIWCEMKNAKNFKRPKNREDKSDLDKHLTEQIAAMKSIIWKIFGGAGLQKNSFQNVERASCDPRGRWHARSALNQNIER